MGIFRKIKTLFQSNFQSDFHSDSSSAAEAKEEIQSGVNSKNYDGFSLENLSKQIFIEAESAYQHQDRKIDRYEFGEAVRLGTVLDFLLDSDVAVHLTGMSVCSSTLDERNASVSYVKDAGKIADYDILKQMTRTDENGELVPVRGLNLTVTLLRDNGLSVVLFVRNMYCVPGMLYVRIYSLVNGTNDNDDLRILDTENYPLMKSTLISCRTNSGDMSEMMRLYSETTAQVKKKLEKGDDDFDKFQLQAVKGMSGYRILAEYNGYGDYLYSQDRYFDAQRQYIRLIRSLVPYPAENIKNGNAYGLLNYKMSQCLLHTHDAVSAFHYMDIAFFLNQNIGESYLMTLAKLADYRFGSRLSGFSDGIESDKQAELKKVYADSVADLRQQTENELPYLSMGFLLGQLLRVHKYNIFPMHVFRLINNEYQHECVGDREKVWSCHAADVLQNGSTVVIGYSCTVYGCKLKDDQSILCYENSIIMHADKIPGSELLRVNVIIPAFVNDPDKIFMTKEYLPEYYTFIMSAKPFVYDFALQDEKIAGMSSKLYSQHRAAEALVGSLHLYHKLLLEYDSASAEKQYACLDAAAKTGMFFMELNLPYLADYYLNAGFGTMSADNVTEYINCLVNTKDVRAMSLVDKMLLKHSNLNEDDNKIFMAYLKRRKAYILIDWGMILQAKDLLRSMLDDPLCSNFAKDELDYIEQNKL